jgi:hypothetical protein
MKSHGTIYDTKGGGGKKTKSALKMTTFMDTLGLYRELISKVHFTETAQ